MFLYFIFKRKLPNENKDEKLYQQMFKSNQAAKLLIDRETGNIIDANPSACEFYGYSLSEMQKTTIFDLNINNKEYVNECMEQAWKEEKKSFLFKHRSKSGIIYDVEVFSGPVEVRGKKYLFSIINDVTQKNSVLKALEKSETKFRYVFENVPVGIYQSTVDGKIISANPSLIKMFGYDSLEEFLSIDIEKDIYVNPKDRKNLIDKLENYDKVRNLEVLLKMKNGLHFIALESSNTVRDDAGRIIYFQGILSDVTLLKKREQQLKENSEFLENILESITNPFIVVDIISYTIEMCNTSAYEIITNSSEKCYRSLFGFDCPCLELNYKCPIEEVKSKKEAVVVQRTLFDKKGNSEKTLEIFAHPVFDENDEITHIIESIHDITEKKKAEQELVTLRKAVETSDEIIFMTDKDGTFTYVNPAFTKYYGYPSKEVINSKTPRIIKSDNMSTEDYKMFWETILNKKIARTEFINKTKSNDMIIVEASVNQIRNENDELSGFLAIQRDVTESRMHQKQLKESEEKYKKLFDSAQVGIFRSDLEEDRLLMSNQAFLDILGISGDSTQNNVIDSFLFDSFISVKDRLKIISELKKEGFIRNREFETKRKADGKTINVLINLRLLKEEKTIEGTITDITKLKETENELKSAKQKAEEANKLKSEFLANISHELRTPLTSIIGFMQILQSHNNLKDKERFEYRETVLNSAKDLLLIINGILDTSKIESGKIKLEISKINIRNLLKNVESMIKPQISNKKLGFKLKISENIPEYIKTDYSKLNQILINLIGNALKFTEKGKITLEVSMSAKIIHLSEDEFFLIFKVKDTGIGIPDERRDLIFEPFVQADGSLTRSYGGTGLGLSITKNFVELMGGRIWADSHIGEGTTFQFTIRTSNASEPRDTEKENINQSLNDKQNRLITMENPNDKKRILLVEDDEGAIKIIEVLIRKLGQELIIVKNGKQAIMAVEKEKPDLILMDIQLPLIDGEEATRRIRDDDNNKDIPIIAMTAHAMKGDREKFIDAGCNEYVSKPFNIEELKLLIKEYLHL